MTTTDNSQPIPRRPRARNAEVRTAAVMANESDILAWFDLTPPEEGDDPSCFERFKKDRDTVMHTAVLAVMDAPDAFTATKILDDNGWEACDGLFDIMSNIIRTSIPKARDAAVRAWVIASGVRTTNDEGDRIEFKEGEVTVTGDVLAVMRSEARLIVKPAGYHLGMPPMSVDAENVIRTILTAAEIKAQNNKATS